MPQKASVQIKEIVKESGSYLKDIQFLIIFTWIIGYFSCSFDKDLKLFKFSWVSWTTLTSLSRIIILTICYVLVYKSFFSEIMAKNISISKVHEISMAHEFFFASVSDLFMFVCFPKMAANLASLVHLLGEMEGKVKTDNSREKKQVFTSQSFVSIYVCRWNCASYFCNIGYDGDCNGLLSSYLWTFEAG